MSTKKTSKSRRPAPIRSSKWVCGVELIRRERLRQMLEEGWSPEHDNTHRKFEMTLAAMSYAAVVATPDEWAGENGTEPQPLHDWPWAKKWWKPCDDPVRNLVKAGALICAEIDRLQRAKRHPHTLRVSDDGERANDVRLQRRRCPRSPSFAPTACSGAVSGA